MNLPGEQWADIPGWRGQYQASNKGRIRSLPRTCEGNRWPRHREGQIRRVAISKRTTSSPVVSVQLFHEGARTTFRVNELVHMTWQIHLTTDQIILANEDNIPNGIPVICECPSCMFPSMSAAAAYFDVSASSIKTALLGNRAVNTPKGHIKFRLLTPEEREEYRELLIEKEAIV